MIEQKELYMMKRKIDNNTPYIRLEKNNRENIFEYIEMHFGTLKDCVKQYEKMKQTKQIENYKEICIINDDEMYILRNKNKDFKDTRLYKRVEEENIYIYGE